jgi:signal transduction histidine kinase
VRPANWTDSAPFAAAARWSAIAWLLLLGTAFAAHSATSPADMRFDHAEFVISSDDTPPAGGWRPQALPDSWLHNHRGLAGIGWYRMRFELDAVPAYAMALYVSRVAVTGQFWLNGSLLNPEVRFTQAGGPIGTYTGRRPHLIPLPAGLFRVGENELHIRVQGFAIGGNGLWDVRIAELDRLRAPWLLRYIPQRTIPEALFALMAASFLFALLVWWRDPQARDLLFISVMGLWALILGLYCVPALSLTREGLTIFLAVLFTVFYWALLALFHRYSESRWHWYPRVLHVVSALTLLCAFVVIALDLNTERFTERMGLVMLPMALLRLLATVMLVQAAWRKRSAPSIALAAAEVLWLSGHVQIIGIFAGWLSPEPFRIDPACSLPLFFVLQLLFVERFVHSREQAAREQQAAISAERARILQDMHDGMGSQLITALRIVKREDGDRTAVAQSIEEALQDLRLIIDSLAVGDQGLVQLLGNLRYRLEPRLAALGIDLRWNVQPFAELDTLTPQFALAVLRIVQEALTNAIKHARPAVITVSIERRDGAVLIGVADDGIGFDSEGRAGTGRGLSSMRKRAQQLGATFHIERLDGGGTFASLRLPETVT